MLHSLRSMALLVAGFGSVATSSCVGASGTDPWAGVSHADAGEHCCGDQAGNETSQNSASDARAPNSPPSGAEPAQVATASSAPSPAALEPGNATRSVSSTSTPQSSSPDASSATEPATSSGDASGIVGGEGSTDAGSSDVPAPSPASDEVGDGGVAQGPCLEQGQLVTGTSRTMASDRSFSEALAELSPGDRLVLQGGNYGDVRVTNREFSDYVFVQAAAGESVTFSGLRFDASSHIVLDGISVDGTLELNGSSAFVLRNVTLDAGNGDDAALQFQGQDSAGATHDVVVQDSVIRGGGRTVFVLGRFAPSDTWNHHLSFINNEVNCGKNVCFQISGGRDLMFERNRIDSSGNTGILTAGATRVTISRNWFSGSGASAMQIATPGAEWDNYAGVENMVSSEITIVNNVLEGWGAGVQFDAATQVSVVNNTVSGGTGLRFNHRVPRDQSDNVILDGNSEIRVWNNILPSVAISNEEGRPAFESNNLVSGSGGGGSGLVNAAPAFESEQLFTLAEGSPAINAGLLIDDTPEVDFNGALRDQVPDIGAKERGAAPPACP